MELEMVHVGNTPGGADIVSIGVDLYVGSGTYWYDQGTAVRVTRKLEVALNYFMYGDENSPS